LPALPTAKAARANGGAEADVDSAAAATAANLAATATAVKAAAAYACAKTTISVRSTTTTTAGYSSRAVCRHNAKLIWATESAARPAYTSTASTDRIGYSVTAISSHTAASTGI
jgi:hypothetical protein